MKTANHEIIKLNPDLNMRYQVIEVPYSYSAMHWHNSMEILFVRSGKLYVSTNESSDILSANDFAVIDRKQIHTTVCKEPSKFLLIQIPYEFLKQFLPNIESLRIPYVCSLSVKDKRIHMNALRDILVQLTGLCENQYKNYQLKYYSLIFDFLDLLVRQFKIDLSSKEIRQTEKYIERLSLITDYVSNHYHEPISLEEGANVLSVTPEYFARFFKKYMGVTFLDYVYSIRLQAAYQDVLNTDLSIQEIQNRNGFTSPKIFSRMFREQYSMTPREVRRLL